MASYNRAREFLDRASRCLQEARNYFNNPSRIANYPLAITRAHECLELSLKAVLILAGRSKLPHTHDLSENLTGVIKKLPEWFQEKIPSFSLNSKVISIIRIYATYGYEPTGTPPKQLFKEHDANMCIKNAEDVWYNCNRLYYEMQKSKL